MHPAPSLILFTSLSGLGFGLLTFLGLATPGLVGWHAFLAFALAFGLACGGLLSSLLHLGNPQRAWRALSQWRSSWLSREGVLAIATLMAFAPVAMARIWWLTDLPLLAVVASLLALTTVFATAMIYAQLRTVPRWHHPLVPAVFLASTLTGGALLSGQTAAAALFLVVLGGLQAAYWHLGDGLFAASGSDMTSATGLGRAGSVRLLERPHTGASYLTKEMMFQVGRRRVVALRRLFWVLGIALPLLFVVLAILTQGLGASLTPLSLLAASASHIVGLIAARWLFYAQAEHVVALYYGAQA